jgi:hypothetical protein
MITPAFGLTATERVLPKLALDFTTAVLDARVTVTRTTNATNPATYINSSGVITAATNNQPRFDYDPVTLFCKGLLIEEARANSLLNTDLLATQIVTVTAAVRTLSFYGTGTVTLSGTHTAVVSGTGAYPTRTTYSFTPSVGALTLTVTGTVQFAQLELGAFATSYIPTTTTSLTRNTDAVQMTGTNFSSWYNASEGSFVARYTLLALITTSSQELLNMNDGTSTNVITVNANNTAGSVGATATTAGAGQGFINVAGVAANTAQTIAYRYALNNSAIAFNASAPVVDTTYNVPTGINSIAIGSRINTFGVINGHMQRFFYYPQGLTNAELTAFSK